MGKESRRSFLKKSTIASLGTTLLGSNLLAKQEDCPIPSETQEITTSDLYGQGPFYTPDAPQLNKNELAEQNENGDRLILSGYILDNNTQKPLPNTEIDVWHADNNGQYDNEGYKLRGKAYSDENGFYTIKTIKPGLYLNGATYRPSHIHFKITPPNESTLITQLYFEDDPYIAEDRAASLISGNFDASKRIIPLTLNSENIFEGCWNVYFDTNEVISSTNHNLDKGSIYYASFDKNNDVLKLHIGTHQQGKIEVRISTLQGTPITFIEQISTPRGKDYITIPTQGIKNGTYIAQLIVNNSKTVPIKFLINR